MDNFRFTTIELMAVVVLAALDIAAFRYPLIGRPVSEVLLMLGGLPTANILAIGLLLLCRQSWAKGLFSPAPGWIRGRWLGRSSCIRGGA